MVEVEAEVVVWLGCTTLMAAVAVGSRGMVGESAAKSDCSAARQPATMSDLKIMPCAASG